MVSETLEMHSGVAGLGTDGRSPRATLEQRLAGTPQEVRSAAVPLEIAQTGVPYPSRGLHSGPIQTHGPKLPELPKAFSASQCSR